jgi:hypothetical protein
LDYRLSVLPKESKGIVLWVIEAKVLVKLPLFSQQVTAFICISERDWNGGK